MTTPRDVIERTSDNTETAQIACANEAIDRALSDTAEIDLTWRSQEPGTSAWAMAADSLTFLARLVRQLQPEHVVEFGSGVSTELLLRESTAQQPRFYLTTIEHDPRFARKTVMQVGHHVLLETFALSVAPLVGRGVAGKFGPVYHINAIHPASPLPADLALVDGPPAPLGGRYGAVVQAVAMSRPGSIILLDDASRSGERNILLTLSQKLEDAIDVRELPGFERGLAAVIVRDPLPCRTLMDKLEPPIPAPIPQGLVGRPRPLTQKRPEIEIPLFRSNQVEEPAEPISDAEPSPSGTSDGKDTAEPPATSPEDIQRYPRTIAAGRASPKTIEFVTSTSCRSIAEIGIYHGGTSFKLAEFLNHQGELHLFDFADRVEDVVSRLRAAGYSNVVGHANSYKYLDSYNWSLMRLLEQHTDPIFDYVFIDGAHTWALDALAFLLVDRLLKPGGYVDFDDYSWALGRSPSLRPDVFPLTAELYTAEQISSPQVRLVLDLLVRRDGRYREVVSNRIFQKLDDASAPNRSFWTNPVDAFAFPSCAVIAGIGPRPPWLPEDVSWLRAPFDVAQRKNEGDQSGDGDRLIAWIEAAAGAGAQWVVIPSERAELLEEHPKLADSLTQGATLVTASLATGIVFRLDDASGDATDSASTQDTARGNTAQIVADFSSLYYEQASTTWTATSWLGRQVLKCPFDLWIYQEILNDVRPELIIETGTWHGASALYLATICDAIGVGEIVSIDVAPKPELPAHPRVTYLTGSSTAPDILENLRRRAAQKSSVLVILDSDHSRDNVLTELRLYQSLVTSGSYLIVEDTNLNGHPVLPDFGPGPMEAVEAFLAETNDFVPDPAREKFFLTFNPKGYLRRR